MNSAEDFFLLSTTQIAILSIFLILYIHIKGKKKEIADEEIIIWANTFSWIKKKWSTWTKGIYYHPFRKIGKEDLKEILKQSINLWGDDMKEKLLARNEQSEGFFHIEQIGYDAKPIEKEIHRIKRRMLAYILSMTKNAWINLGIGFFGTITGTVLLYFFITAKDFQTDNGFVHIYRLSIVFILEIVDLFFLRLYRNTQEEIKYYQNEFSNMEFKALAIRLASDDGINNVEAIQELIHTFSNTERNFILKKGESTVDLEMKKAEQSEEGMLLKTLEKFIASISRVKKE